jgi:Protein of unknown function (DUF1326)
MKTLICAAFLASFLPGYLRGASVAPSGEVVELHACELYTGGCTASAQSTLGGRSLLRVWSFEKGAQDGVELRGLQIGALQIAEENLAFRATRPSATVIYLPAQASDAQRGALVSWLRHANPEFAAGPLIQKIAEISLSREGSNVAARIGRSITLQTRAIEHCDAGGCGESLWYSPRSKTGSFTVLVDERSSVQEPAVSLVWKSSGAKNVFLARFGGGENPEPSFSLAALD